MKVNLQENNAKKVRIIKSGGIVMKITIELNREEFDMALDTGALKSLSMALKKPSDEERTKQDTFNEPIQDNTPTQTVNPIGPSPIPATPIPVQAPPVQNTVPIQAQSAQNTIPVQMQMPSVVPTSTQSYTMEQLAVAAQQLMDAGRINELRQLLASFGAQSLMTLPKEQYGAFATQLRAMGAKI